MHTYSLILSLMPILKKVLHKMVSRGETITLTITEQTVDRMHEAIPPMSPGDLEAFQSMDSEQTLNLLRIMFLAGVASTQITADTESKPETKPEPEPEPPKPEPEPDLTRNQTVADAVVTSVCNDVDLLMKLFDLSPKAEHEFAPSLLDLLNQHRSGYLAAFPAPVAPTYVDMLQARIDRLQERLPKSR